MRNSPKQIECREKAKQFKLIRHRFEWEMSKVEAYERYAEWCRKCGHPVGERRTWADISASIRSV